MCHKRRPPNKGNERWTGYDDEFKGITLVVDGEAIPAKYLSVKAGDVTTPEVLLEKGLQGDGAAMRQYITSQSAAGRDEGEIALLVAEKLVAAARK